MTDPTLEEIARRAEAATPASRTDVPHLLSRLREAEARADAAKQEVVRLNASLADKVQEAWDAEMNAKSVSRHADDLQVSNSALRAKWKAEVASNAALREALKPFAKIGKLDAEMQRTGNQRGLEWSEMVEWDDFRRARAALDEKEKG